MDTRAATHEPRDDALMALLAGWLPGRRWFPAKNADADLTCIGGLTLIDPADEAEIRVLLVRAVAPGVDIVLQVPLTLRGPGASAAAPVVGTLAPAATAAEHGSARMQVHDGVGDPAFLRAWLAAAEGPGAHVAAERARVITGEQSNTSVILPGASGTVDAVEPGHGAAILKVFRALAPGDNPDVDVPRALTAVGWDHVPRPLAWLHATWPSGPDTFSGHLGVLSEFVPDARDGFELACAMAARGESFAELARELGEVVAGMHAALARALPVAGTPAGVDRTDGVARSVRQRFRWAVEILPELARYADRVELLAAGTQAVLDPPARQRIHGDLHLGQVLRGRNRWYVLDFEGEPLTPIAERTRPDLPLRDVAGMLRSIDYAAAVGRASTAGTAVTGARAAGDETWAADARHGLLDGYRHGATSDVGRAVLLRALEIDKALYEAVYEARNRPDWLGIPLAALDRLLAQPSESDRLRNGVGSGSGSG
jgi:maltokinase